MVSFLLIFSLSGVTANAFARKNKPIKLPEPGYEGSISVEQAISQRKSVRNFGAAPLMLEEVSQILWAAGGATIDGVTGPTRAYPSARGMYPLEIYLVAGDVSMLGEGIYWYDWREHSLTLIREGDFRKELSHAALGQGAVLNAPVSIVVVGNGQKTGKRQVDLNDVRYMSMDAGHMGQNVHLETESMGLGTVMVGGFTDKEVLDLLGIKDRTVIYVMPVGKPRQ